MKFYCQWLVFSAKHHTKSLAEVYEGGILTCQKQKEMNIVIEFSNITFWSFETNTCQLEKE